MPLVLMGFGLKQAKARWPLPTFLMAALPSDDEGNFEIPLPADVDDGSEDFRELLQPSKAGKPKKRAAKKPKAAKGQRPPLQKAAAKPASSKGKSKKPQSSEQNPDDVKKASVEFWEVANSYPSQFLGQTVKLVAPTFFLPQHTLNNVQRVTFPVPGLRCLSPT